MIYNMIYIDLHLKFMQVLCPHKNYLLKFYFYV